MYSLEEDELRKKALEDAKEQLTAKADKQKLMMKAVQYLESLDQEAASEVDKFRDWYSIHFPELEDQIEDNEELIKILGRETNKEELSAFEDLAQQSKGKKLDEKDHEILSKVADNIEETFTTIEHLENYIGEIAQEEMPNLSGILGNILAAKIVYLAGGLDELAKKPSSTVQMLGAEKALFRHLRQGGKPPKHGVLFEHKFVNQLPDDKRGKMARFLANKAVLAARLDNYGDKNKAEEMREEIQDKYREIKDN